MPRGSASADGAGHGLTHGPVWTGVLSVLTVAASVLVVVLALRVRQLTDEVRHLRFERRLPQVGDVLSPLRAAFLDGDSVDLARPGPGHWQVWFVFDSRCPMCRASLPEWTAAFNRLRTDSAISVLGVSLDSGSVTHAYVETHRIPFPVALLGDSLDAARYRIPGVPLTLVLDEVGRLVLVRPGVLSRSAADSLVLITAGTVHVENPAGGG